MLGCRALASRNIDVYGFDTQMRAFFTLSNVYAADKRLLYRQLYIENAFRFSNFVAAQFSKTLCAHVWVRVVTTSR